MLNSGCTLSRRQLIIHIFIMEHNSVEKLSHRQQGSCKWHNFHINAFSIKSFLFQIA